LAEKSKVLTDFSKGLGRGDGRVGGRGKGGMMRGG